jgi:CBS domain-containing protein
MVQRGDEVIGLLTVHNIREHPRTEWSTTTAVKAMIPMAQVKQTEPDADLWEALEEMDRDGVNQLPVMKDEQLQGMLSRGDVITYLRTLRQLDT